MKRIISMIIVVAMLLTSVPANLLDCTAAQEDAAQEDAAPKEPGVDLLLQGFNVLGDKEFTRGNLNKLLSLKGEAFMLFNEFTYYPGPQKFEAVYLASNNFEAFSKMQDFDISRKLSYEIGASVPAIASAKSKFKKSSNSSSAYSYSNSYDKNFSTLKIFKKLGKNKIIDPSYVLSAYNKTLLDNGSYSESFKYALTQGDIDHLFNTYGTHIVTSYNFGGYAEKTASVIKTDSEEKKSIAEALGLGNSASANCNIKTVGLDAAIKMNSDVSNKMEEIDQNAYKIEHVESRVVGGTVNHNFDFNSSESCNNWLNSVKPGDPKATEIFLDNDLQMVGIWELLPKDIYEKRRNELKAFYLKKANEMYDEFYENYIYSVTNIPPQAEMPKPEIEGYTLISTAEQFNNIRNNLSGKYVLTNNIDLSDYSNWTPIGDANKPFKGILDGNGNTVKGVKVQSKSTTPGLFGVNNGTIKTLEVIYDTTRFGGVAGVNNGTIKDCYVDLIFNNNKEYKTINRIPDKITDKQVFVDLSGVETSSVSKTVIVANTVEAIKFKGSSNRTFTGLNIVVEGDTDIVFENFKFKGNTSAPALKFTGNNPAIISIGSGNSIENNGVYDSTNNRAVLDAANNLYVCGSGNINVTHVTQDVSGRAGMDAIIAGTLNIALDAKFTANGGDGISGSDGSTDDIAHGENGQNGANGTSKNLAGDGSNGSDGDHGGNGGSGGNGGAGENGAPTDNRKKGGNGGLGGNGSHGANGNDSGDSGRGIVANQLNIMNDSQVYFYGGNGGTGGNGGNGGNGGSGGNGAGWMGNAINGGNGGTGGNGGDGGNGGNGGNGGDGGTAAAISDNNPVQAPSSYLFLQAGNGGTAGSGGDAGNAGSGGAGGKKGSGTGSGSNGSDGTPGQSGSRGTVGQDGNGGNNGSPLNSSSSSASTIYENGTPAADSNENAIWKQDRIILNSVNKSTYELGNVFDVSSLNVSFLEGGATTAKTLNTDQIDILYDFSKVGNTLVTITYYIDKNVDINVDKNVNKNKVIRYIPVSVVEPKLDKTTFVTPKTNFTVGEEFNWDGLALEAHYSNGSLTLTTDNFIVDYPEDITSTSGIKEVTVTHPDFQSCKSTYKVSVQNTTNQIIRLSGTSRIDTANTIAKYGWGSADTVLLANGLNFADALAGGPLSKALDAPILLTVNGAKLEQSIVDTIKSLGAKNVIILGGTNAVKVDFQSQLKNELNQLNISRLYGSNRYATAIRIAEELYKMQKFDTVYIADGTNFPDALAASPVAAIKGCPILFTNPTDKMNLTVNTAEYINEINVKSTVVLGGTSIISDTVKSKLPNASRIAGKNRYETAVEIYKENQDIFTKNIVSCATGANFPDALAGSAYAAKISAPLLLLNNAVTVKSVQDTIISITPIKTYILGGTAVISDNTINNML